MYSGPTAISSDGISDSGSKTLLFCNYWLSECILDLPTCEMSHDFDFVINIVTFDMM